MSRHYKQQRKRAAEPIQMARRYAAVIGINQPCDSWIRSWADYIRRDRSNAIKEIAFGSVYWNARK